MATYSVYDEALIPLQRSCSLESTLIYSYSWPGKSAKIIEFTELTSRLSGDKMQFFAKTKGLVESNCGKIAAIKSGREFPGTLIERGMATVGANVPSPTDSSQCSNARNRAIPCMYYWINTEYRLVKVPLCGFAVSQGGFECSINRVHSIIDD